VQEGEERLGRDVGADTACLSLALGPRARLPDPPRSRSGFPALSSVIGGLAALMLARRVEPLQLGVAGFVAMIFGIGTPLGVAPISAILTTRAPAAIRPEVVSAFLAITSAGTPLGAAGAGLAIDRVGFRPTYVGVAGAMTLATALLVACARRLRERPTSAVPATSAS